MHIGAWFAAVYLLDRYADCVVQKYDIGMTSGILGEQSSALGCTLGLVDEPGQIASLLRPSISPSLHENNVADPCCKALQEPWVKSAWQELRAIVSGA